MRRSTTALLGAALSLAVSSAASAAVLTFEDITSNTVSAPGFVEQGFQFSGNVDAVNIGPGSFFSWIGPAVSGDYAALNDYYGDEVMTVQGGGDFSLSSLFLKGWGGQQPTVTVNGLLDGALVGSMTETLSADAWTEVDANFHNIDTLVVSPNGGNFLTDDVTVGEITAAVPEPATWAMLILGVGMIGFAARRRNAGIALAA